MKQLMSHRMEWDHTLTGVSRRSILIATFFVYILQISKFAFADSVCTYGNHPICFDWDSKNSEAQKHFKTVIDMDAKMEFRTEERHCLSPWIFRTDKSKKYICPRAIEKRHEDSYKYFFKQISDSVGK